MDKLKDRTSSQSIITSLLYIEKHYSILVGDSTISLLLYIMVVDFYFAELSMQLIVYSQYYHLACHCTHYASRSKI